MRSSDDLRYCGRCGRRRDRSRITSLHVGPRYCRYRESYGMLTLDNVANEKMKNTRDKIPLSAPREENFRPDKP